uniref:Uncharacterized protein n=1 Tax=Trichogramma kaykai TaxID=54128 RepID=A0ABD2VYM5_9HYME
MAAAATAAAAEAEQYPRKDLTPLLAPTASCCMHYVYTRARAAAHEISKLLALRRSSNRSSIARMCSRVIRRRGHTILYRVRHAALAYIDRVSQTTKKYKSR